EKRVREFDPTLMAQIEEAKTLHVIKLTDHYGSSENTKTKYLSMMQTESKFIQPHYWLAYQKEQMIDWLRTYRDKWWTRFWVSTDRKKLATELITQVYRAKTSDELLTIIDR